MLAKKLESKYFIDEESFRNWIRENHDSSPGIWMIFYKQHTGKECIEYTEALDTALCYGWIDSIIKRIDDSRYARKFTPRTDISKWSEFNKKRVNELIKNGKMTESGLSKIDSYLKNGKVTWTVTDAGNKAVNQIVYPESVISEFAKNEPALSNFNNLSPTYQKHYILWITSAKREITVHKRISEAIELLKENKKLGLK
jgi:uncharacterized protein YdeI (YjbR/CyaY-like superfamily)